MTTYKIFKNDLKKGYALGVWDTDWEPFHVRINIPIHKACAEIQDGLIFSDIPIEVYYKDKFEPVPALEILKRVVECNKAGIVATASGYRKKGTYGAWFIDFDESLEGFFEQYKLPIPDDRKSIGQKMQAMAMGNLEAQGFITRGLGSEGDAPGRKALEEAKAAKEASEIAELKEQQEKLLKEIADLKAVQKEEKPKVKKKEEAVAK